LVLMHEGMKDIYQLLRPVSGYVAAGLSGWGWV